MKTPLKIEVLYCPECPHFLTALQLVYTAVRETGIEAHVETVRVETEIDAHRLKFLGSPTVRVNGVDVEGHAIFGRRDYGLRCRLYVHNTGAFAYPPLEEIRTTLEVGYLAERGLMGACC